MVDRADDPCHGSLVLSTAGDFRELTPLVPMQALLTAGTEVGEPIETIDLETPEETTGAVYGALIDHRGTIREVLRADGSPRIICDLPTAALRAIERQLPGSTHGDADWETSHATYRPVSGEPFRRPRIGPNPLERAHYLAEVSRG